MASASAWPVAQGDLRAGGKKPEAPSGLGSAAKGPRGTGAGRGAGRGLGGGRGPGRPEPRLTPVVFSRQCEAERALPQHLGLPGRHQDQPGQGSGPVVRAAGRG